MTKQYMSLGAALLCALGIGAVAHAQATPTDKATPPAAQDPVDDPDDPGPAPKDPEPLPDKAELPARGSVDIQSYVDDLPRPPDEQAQAGVVRNGIVGTLCMNAHLQGIGWQGWRCQPNGVVATVGTTGQSRRMEALAVVTYGAGGVCANAHVAGIGWQGWACGADGQVIAVGTTGQSRRMEALGIGSFGANFCARAHVASLGWLGWMCAPPGYAGYVGTTGQSRRMEALDGMIY